jgi:YVTN family beta-propeller protein
MKNIIGLLLLFVTIVSCKKSSEETIGSFLTGDGVFILNEGNYLGGNGSISFYSYDSSKIYNNLFLDINGRPLGDIPNSMILSGEKGYIVVNNSGKIEVVNKNTLESETTISGLISPRNIAIINSSTAYVTSMYSDSVAIISLSDNSISGYINLRRYSEAIVINGNKAFVSYMIGPGFIGGNEVMVINTETDQVVDSIIVGPEPESMVLDKNKMLWVLCNGGWARENFAVLMGINTLSNTIERNLIFPTKQASPSCLQINGSADTLYYLENGVQKMSINSSELPAAPFIPKSDHYFYKMSINPVNNDVIVSDAVDYSQRGYVMIYNKSGTLVTTETADIIPGAMCYKLSNNFQVE